MKTKELVFPSPQHESTFRRVLSQFSNVTTYKDGENYVSSYRPRNIFEFEQRLHQRGLKNCPTTNDVIRFLVQHPSEDIRIVT